MTAIMMTEFRRIEIEEWIEYLVSILDAFDGDENLEPEMAGLDPRCMDDREGDDEREWDLAGASTDVEHDDGYYDAPLLIEGGMEQASSAA